MDSRGEVTSVYPDGFMRVEKTQGDAVYESCYFLEVDRSTERLDVLAERCVAYRHYYRSGSFAKRQGGQAEEYRNHYFRVLVTCVSQERARNIAMALLNLDQPIQTQVLLTTHAELMADPLGTIWLRPKDLETGEKQRLWTDEASA